MLIMFEKEEVGVYMEKKIKYTYMMESTQMIAGMDKAFKLWKTGINSVDNGREIKKMGKESGSLKIKIGEKELSRMTKRRELALQDMLMEQRKELNIKTVLLKVVR